MPRLSLVSGGTVEAWGSAEARWYYRETYRLGVPAVTSLAIESHHPPTMLGFCRLWWGAFYDGIVERSLKEALRVWIASQAGCAYCATSRLPDYEQVDRPEPGAADDSRARAAIAFADILSLRPWDLGTSAWDHLRAAFTESELVELAVFCAWQYAGPRMLRSWGAERYKTGSRPDPEALPVRLAYMDEEDRIDLGPRPIAPPAPEPGSAPITWLAFLRPRPDLAAAWVGLWRVAIDDGPLPARLTQLVRLDLARQLVHPEWAPLDDPSIRVAGIDTAIVAALPMLGPARFDDRERAALGYARAMVAGEDLDDAVETALAEAFTEPELVQLGFAVAIQLGAILLDRSLTNRGLPPIGLVADEVVVP